MLRELVAGELGLQPPLARIRTLLGRHGLQTAPVLGHRLVLGVVDAGLHRLLPAGQERVPPLADAGRRLTDLAREGVEAPATHQARDDLGLPASRPAAREAGAPRCTRSSPPSRTSPCP